MLRAALIVAMVALAAALEAPPVVSFESGDFGYALSTMPPAKATVDMKSAPAAADGEIGIAITVATPGDNTSYVEFCSPLYSFDGGKRYQFKVDARAINKTYITLGVRGGSGAMKDYADYGLTDKFSTYQTKWSTKSDADAKFCIGVGAKATTYHFDKIMIKEIGEYVANAPMPAKKNKKAKAPAPAVAEGVAAFAG